MIELDRALNTVCEQLYALKNSNSNVIFSHIKRNIDDLSRLSMSEFPVGMAGIITADICETTQIGDILLICLFRSRNRYDDAMVAKEEVCNMLHNQLSDDGFQISEIEIGDLMGGLTEPAESSMAIPDGAYIANWIGMKTGVDGFFVRFTITTNSTGS